MKIFGSFIWMIGVLTLGCNNAPIGTERGTIASAELAAADAVQASAPAAVSQDAGEDGDNDSDDDDNDSDDDGSSTSTTTTTTTPTPPATTTTTTTPTPVTTPTPIVTVVKPTPSMESACDMNPYKDYVIVRMDKKHPKSSKNPDFTKYDSRVQFGYKIRPIVDRTFFYTFWGYLGQSRNSHYHEIVFAGPGKSWFLNPVPSYPRVGSTLDRGLDPPPLPATLSEVTTLQLKWIFKIPDCRDKSVCKYPFKWSSHVASDPGVRKGWYEVTLRMITWLKNVRLTVLPCGNMTFPLDSATWTKGLPKFHYGGGQELRIEHTWTLKKPNPFSS